MKRIISLLLSAVLIFSVTVPAFASSKSVSGLSDCDPVILIRGMDFGNVMLDVGTENERKVNNFSASTIVTGVAATLIKWLAAGDKNAAVDSLIETAYSLLKYNSMNENGDPAYNTGMIKYPFSMDNYPEMLEGTDNEMGMLHTFSDVFGGDHVYYVNYDWRLDPFVVADEINDAVRLATENTGHKKVNLVCASMGGIMTVAYLTKYGYENIGRCLFLSSTFCGSQIATDVLTGKIDITSQGLYNYLSSFAEGNALLKLLLSAAKLGGIFSLLTRITDYILENKKTDMYEKVLKPIFGYSPCVWGLIADSEDYEEAIKYMFGSRENVNPVFLSRIDSLRNMMDNRTELLNRMIDDGVKISVLSNYGSPLIPVYESSDFSGDRTLEAYNTSGFATVARFGETLGDNYQAARPELVSPDNCVDLSTAILPEYTYMIRNAPHVAASYGTDYSDFVVYLLKNTGDFKAGSNEKYPQFMLSDLKTQSLKSY